MAGFLPRIARDDQGVGDPNALAARTDEDRVEIDRREFTIGRRDESGEAHDAIDEGFDIARRARRENPRAVSQP